MTSRPAPLVVLLRHGETAWNVEGRFQGQHDTDLTPRGHQQSLDAARALAGVVAGRRLLLVSSDLRRARDTAAAVGVATGVDPLLDPRLREVDAGRWQGLLHEEILELDADGYAAWQAGEDVPLGGAETPTQAGDRVREAVEQHAATLGAGDCLVVVGHGASVRSGLSLLIGQPDLRRVLVPLGNTGTAVLTPTPPRTPAAPVGGETGGWRLHGWNVPPAALSDLLGRRDVPSVAATSA